MSQQVDKTRPIENTKVFASEETQKGYRLNKFAMSMCKRENREAFLADEESVLAAADLTEVERQIIRDRDWRAMMDEYGGNIYMIMKIGAVIGHGLYQIGAHQRGQTYEEFLATRNASGAR
ncbi:MAG: Gallate dioxygenase [Alphaproteobacteria bacterium MarineAlpha11_Bin1]|nr:MAG: Gallate dioxygenase [Alphaproteobacteria bacterium MarineAlpha11_Bin1]